jgi:hypothetical protein
VINERGCWRGKIEKKEFNKELIGVEIKIEKMLVR